MVSEELIERIIKYYENGAEKPDDDIFDIAYRMAKELQIYRGLAQMRKDMLDSELGHVFGGYSEDEIDEFESCTERKL